MSAATGKAVAGAGDKDKAAPAVGDKPGQYQPSKVTDIWAVVMRLEKTTKGTVRYQEEHESDTQPDRIGQLYLQKHNFPDGAPQRIVVQVSTLES